MPLYLPRGVRARGKAASDSPRGRGDDARWLVKDRLTWRYLRGTGAMRVGMRGKIKSGDVGHSITAERGGLREQLCGKGKG